MARKIPAIGITLGDPGGIGSEVLLKAFQQKLPDAKWFFFGPRRVLLQHARQLRLPLPGEEVVLVDIDNIGEAYFGPNPVAAGKATIDYLDSAFDYFKNGKIEALVTGPIQKESWHQSGYNYPGQTEYCAARTQTKEYCMLMAGRRFRIAVHSTHFSLRDALQFIRKDPIIKKIRLLNEEFRRLGVKHPRIGCAALNPHAGEGGAFGKEEMEEIEPALRAARNEGIDVDGPIAPEVIFRIAAKQKKWDVILAMYHDQAMIPLKLLDFENSANVTLGLPLVRTSPDHGTAFDIAGQGKAHAGSMIYAMKLAANWTRRRKRTEP